MTIAFDLSIRYLSPFDPFVLRYCLCCLLRHCFRLRSDVLVPVVSSSRVSRYAVLSVYPYIRHKNWLENR